MICLKLKRRFSMKFSETGFRCLYKRFSYFPWCDIIKKVVADSELIEDADGVLVYGYIDAEAGMSFEVLCCAKIKNEGEFSFFHKFEETRIVLRAGSVRDEEFVLVADGDDESLCEYFSDALDGMKFFEVDDVVEQTRYFEFLDEFRHELYPDDVLVHICKDDMKPEGCWVRIKGIDENCLVGELLNEPDQELGYHMGDELRFSIYHLDDEQSFLVSVE